MTATASVTDLARSFLHYQPRGHTFTVRLNVECRVEVFDRATGAADEYWLSVRTQTGLRTEPPSDHLDPGYDFWMIFSRHTIYIRRTHTSSASNNPTAVPVGDFVSTGWRHRTVAATPLPTAADVSRAVLDWRPLVARSEFLAAGGQGGYAIEYPVKWCDGDAPDKPFRVETGPVLLLDAERARAGTPLAFDDLRWAYLDYRDFEHIRAYIEQPTPIFAGATYQPGPSSPRRHPALTPEGVAAIEARLAHGWEAPVSGEALARLLQTDRYSGLLHLPARTTLYALE
jgi:hypothetical protein